MHWKLPEKEANWELGLKVKIELIYVTIRFEKWRSAFLALSVLQEHRLEFQATNLKASTDPIIQAWMHKLSHA